MAAKRKTPVKKTTKASAPVEPLKQTPTPKLTWYKELWANQAQLSFLLGAVVVIIVALLLLQRMDQPASLQTIDPSPSTQASATPVPTEATIQGTPTLQGVSPSPSGTITDTAAKTEAKNYTIQTGDTLWGIAEKSYGTGYAWQDIAKANRLPHPSLITAGTTLKLPEFYVEKYPQTHTVAQTRTQITPTTYTIKPGDSLWAISIKVYGTGFNWPKIAQVNNLDNPRLIHAGNILTIPKLQ